MSWRKRDVRRGTRRVTERKTGMRVAVEGSKVTGVKDGGEEVTPRVGRIPG